MTRRLPIEHMRRPRRRLGEIVRATVSCPVCGGAVGIVAWRTLSVRLVCLECRLLFGVDLERLRESIHTTYAGYHRALHRTRKPIIHGNPDPRNQAFYHSQATL